MCMGPTHAAMGAHAALVVGLLAHQSPSVVAASMVIACATAGGTAFSPDLDQSAWWRALRRYNDDRGPMRHRGITHWPGLLPIGAVLILIYVPASAQWAAGAVLTGWASHMFWDAIFGKAYMNKITGAVIRGRGIPWAPWWAHHGLGLKVNGRGEKVLLWASPVIILGQAVLYLKVMMLA